MARRGVLYGLKLGSGLLLVFLPMQRAEAAGFAIPAQSASSVGTAGAADVSSIQDISAIYSNPAAMGAFKGQQFSLGLASLNTSSKFQDGKRTIPGSGGMDAGDTHTSQTGFVKGATVPSIFGVHTINDKVNVGWSLTVPYGTSSDYGTEWVGRYHATKTELTVLNGDIGGSYRICDKLVLGFGVQIQRASGHLAGASNGGALAVQSASAAFQAALSSPKDYAALTGIAAQIKTAFEAIPAAQRAASPKLAAQKAVAETLAQYEGKNDIMATYDGSDLGYGFVLGLMWDPTEDLRVGFSYRSQVKHKSKGTIKFEGETAMAAQIAATNPLTVGGDANLPITVPDVIGLGASYKAMQDLTLYANLTDTRWSSLDKLDITYAGGAQDILVKLEWKDVYTAAVGGAYNVSPNIVLRAGLGMDQSPTKDQYRTPRAPDNDRTLVALGAGYQKDNWKVDAALEHVMVKDPTLQIREVDYAQANGRGNLDGKYKLTENTFMLQYGLAL